VMRALLVRPVCRPRVRCPSGHLGTADLLPGLGRGESVASSKGAGTMNLTGEVEARPGDVVGLAVSIAKRICDLVGPRESSSPRP
jgi:hypothetical protein